MHNEYLISKNDSIIIYGAATVGIRIFKILLENNFNIEAFIDKRADEISTLLGYPVLNINDKDCLERKKNSIVIVAVKNVFEHNKIAETLLKIGFNKIIYKPYWELIGCANEEQQIISKVYDSFIKNKIDISIKVPFANKNDSIKLLDFGTVKNFSNYKIVNIPAEMIFTNLGSNSEWDDIPIAALYPHIEFFETLDGNMKTDIIYYQKYCEQAALQVKDILTTENWKKNVIQNRIDIFWQMQQSLEIDFDFFIRNPITAIYNIKGYFNLTGGKHRAAFFIAHNYSYIPVKITNDDYKKWINNNLLLSFEKRIQTSAISELPEALPHPMLYRFPSVKGIDYLRIQQKIIRFIASYSKQIYSAVDFKKISVCDLVSKYGIFNRVLQKAGCEVVTIENELPNDFLTIANLLTNTKEKKLISIENKEIDIVIVEGNDVFKIIKVGYKIIIHLDREIGRLEGYKFYKEIFRSFTQEKILKVSVFIKD